MEYGNYSSRGIQQDDVWSAADSLIADGLRPTIERVRQKIGRGSPNTVSPMLDAWFSTLGTRLGLNQKTDDSSNIPKILQLALKDVWEITLSNSREQAALEIVQAQTELMQASQALDKRETDIEQAELLRAVKLQALEDAIQAARNGTEEALIRLSVAQAMTGKLDTEIQSLQHKLDVVETERAFERRSNQEATANDILERQKIAERAQATQRQLLEEVDRARQETKKAESDALAAKKRYTTEKIFLLERNNACEKDLAKVQTLCAAKSSDHNALRQASAVSDSRSHEIENLLRTQLANNSNTIARLTEALSRQTDQPAKSAGFMARKTYRTIRIRKS